MNSNELARDFVSKLLSLTSGYDKSTQKIAIKRLLQEHPSLQQDVMRFFMMFVEELAKLDGDIRNEASRNLARKIMELDEEHLILPRM